MEGTGHQKEGRDISRLLRRTLSYQSSVDLGTLEFHVDLGTLEFQCASAR